jgi:hypothetical protein
LFGSVAVTGVVWLVAAAGQFSFEVDERRKTSSPGATTATLLILLLILIGGLFAYLHYAIPDHLQTQVANTSPAVTLLIFVPVIPVELDRTFADRSPLR